MDDAEDATSDMAECGSSFIPPVSTLDTNGKTPNKKVGLHLLFTKSTKIYLNEIVCRLCILQLIKDMP